MGTLNPDGGPHFSDPRRLPKGYIESGATGMSNHDISFDYFNAVAGWTYLGEMGTGLDTSFSADTWLELLSVSGQAGYMAGAIGPTMATATDTTTFGVAVDGAPEVEIPIVGAGTNVRCVLGYPIPRTLYTSADATGHGFALASDKSRIAPGDPASADAIMMPVQRGLLQGVGMLWFSTSLVVRCKTTQAQATTTARERRSGVIWQRMY